jgi:nitrate/nitrite transport system substrate-binding protein
MTKITRRTFITTSAAAATAVLVHGCTSNSSTTSSPGTSPDASPGTSPDGAAGGEAPEVTSAKLGFIALTDSAPLIIAKEKKFFEKYGMKDVTILKQASWGGTRDNLELGSASGGIDGAHILTPMPYQLTTGKNTKGNKPVPMSILARLNTNGQGITIADAYRNLKLDVNSNKFKAAVDAGAKTNKKVKVAMTFPGGTHDMWVRYWLAAGGINPDTDVSLIVVPPPQMVANMGTKTMDVFCVGEPWNDRAISKKLGYSAVTTGEIWKDHPEKSFAMRADWVSKYPKAAQAITAAIIEAQVWCDDPANRQELCKIISAEKYVNAPVTDIIERIGGTFDMGNGRVLKDSPLVMKFWRDNASYPYKSHDLWFLTEHIRWGMLPADTKTQELVDKVNREDIWKAAAKQAGQTAIPTSSSRGVETFFDGVKFDPKNPKAYLSSLKIKKA